MENTWALCVLVKSDVRCNLFKSKKTKEKMYKLIQFDQSIIIQNCVDIFNMMKFISQHQKRNGDEYISIQMCFRNVLKLQQYLSSMSTRLNGVCAI